MLSALIACTSSAMCYREDPRAAIQEDLTRRDDSIKKLYAAINDDIQVLKQQGQLTEENVLNLVNTRVGNCEQLKQDEEFDNAITNLKQHDQLTEENIEKCINIRDKSEQYQSKQQERRLRLGYRRLFGPITRVTLKIGPVHNFYMNANGTQLGILEELEDSSIKVLNVWEKLESTWEKKPVVAWYAPRVKLKWEKNSEEKFLLKASIYRLWNDRDPLQKPIKTIDLTADLERVGCSFKNIEPGVWDSGLEAVSACLGENIVDITPSKKRVYIEHTPAPAEIAKYLWSEALKQQ